MKEIALATRPTDLDVTPLVKSIATDEASAFFATRSRPHLTEEARLETVARFGVPREEEPPKKDGVRPQRLKTNNYDSNQPAD